MKDQVGNMKLKKECIRDLMLYFEKNLTYDRPISANKIALKKYSTEDIVYTCDKLQEAGFINVTRWPVLDDGLPFINVNSITYNGHQLLDNIRSPKIWKETKSKLKSIGSVSVEIIAQVAASLIANKLGV